MQTAPDNYDDIYREGNFSVEYLVEIDSSDYDQDAIWSLRTSRRLFSDNTPMIGCAMVGQIDLTVTNLEKQIAKRAKIKPYIRLRSNSDPSLVSGWVQKGEFFIDTRQEDDDDGICTIEIQGYDAMRKANRQYPSSMLTWSASSPTSLQVVQEIASFIGVPVDAATVSKLSGTPYVIAFPAQYTMLEVLGSIAAMYGGNFCISDVGSLMLVGLMDLPADTNYLVDENGYCITFGRGENETVILTQ